MKRIVLVLMMVLVAIPACEYQDIIGVTASDPEIGRIENYDFKNDIPEFESIEQAAIWVSENSIYITDKELFNIKEYWQTPQEFYYNRNDQNKMQGDCEDYSLFLSYILYKKLNLDVKIIIHDTSNSEIFHAIVYCNERYIEPKTGFVNYYIYFNIIYEIPYSEAIWMAYYYHNLVEKYSL